MTVLSNAIVLSGTERQVLASLLNGVIEILYTIYGFFMIITNHQSLPCKMDQPEVPANSCNTCHPKTR